jgi:HK97 family phage major capsid protein
MKMTDSSGRFIFQPASQTGEPDRLLNRPLKTSEAMPGLTTGNKDVLLETSITTSWGCAGP